jgi:hypothetical protein
MDMELETLELGKNKANQMYDGYTGSKRFSLSLGSDGKVR